MAPDTSPRGCGIEGEEDSWDFGTGAGFYVDATEEKWKTNYNMYSYVTKELPTLIKEHFPVLPDKQSIFGHSMGGHGALICALKNPGMYKSVSAFSPICNPMNCPWGQKAFTGEIFFGVEGFFFCVPHLITSPSLYTCNLCAYWMGSCPISLDSGQVCAVFERVCRMSQIQARRVQCPVILDGYMYPFNEKFIVYRTHHP